ncbi:MAG: hypothetical protein FRX48_00460 [Lasallia pustulata]|uniref:Uncharacterized protein n=1 Tax=Lasallia pustulata TaxID=136370 RepID=A0A5M8Q1X4_9LECA|nr:MAG: hypothetical protein FRX48_00460 [Lasallia pustulata]
MHSLLEKAEGMFRWVDCQLQAIRTCSKVTSVYNVLNRFPKDLYEQYKSDLARVPDGDVEDALKLLQRLTFSQRKLRLEEVVDLLAVDTKADFPVFNVKEPTIPHSQILVICGSLMRANINKAGCNDLGDEAEVTTLTVSHSTVLEFLTSQPIKIGSLPEYSTPLVAASALGSERIVVAFLSNGADPTLAGNYSWGSPLAAAI